MDYSKKLAVEDGEDTELANMTRLLAQKFLSKLSDKGRKGFSIGREVAQGVISAKEAKHKATAGEGKKKGAEGAAADGSDDDLDFNSYEAVDDVAGGKKAKKSRKSVGKREREVDESPAEVTSQPPVKGKGAKLEAASAAKIVAGAAPTISKKASKVAANNDASAKGLMSLVANLEGVAAGGSDDNDANDDADAEANSEAKSTRKPLAEMTELERLEAEEAELANYNFDHAFEGDADEALLDQISLPSTDEDEEEEEEEEEDEEGDDYGLEEDEEEDDEELSDEEEEDEEDDVPPTPVAARGGKKAGSSQQQQSRQVQQQQAAQPRKGQQQQQQAPPQPPAPAIKVKTVNPMLLTKQQVTKLKQQQQQQMRQQQQQQHQNSKNGGGGKGGKKGGGGGGLFSGGNCGGWSDDE